MTLALEGIKVIEMGTFGPAGFASGWLGDMGADVIMVESPSNRAMSTDWREGGRTRAVHCRNKRSIVLDLKTGEARTILHQLAKTTDVLIEANRPGIAKRLGFDYETLSAINPRIIVCSVTGYGQSGPYAQIPGHGLVWEATAGWLRMHGQGYGNTGGDYTGRPWLNYFNLPDMKGSSNTMVSILLALYAREKVGVGQYLDLALFDGVIAVKDAPVPSEGDGAFTHVRPSWNVYECKDGKYIAFAAGEEVQWRNLCEAIGQPALAKERGASEQRGQEIIQIFNKTFKTRTRDEWFAQISKVDTEVAKVNTIDEARDDPQVKTRGMHVEVVGDGGQREIQYGNPFRLSKTPGRAVHRRAPKAGEHTDQLLSGLGYAPADIRRLRQAGAVK
ncbi:MAG: CaiB/BaiF CoA-transferase family protein [Dehalococcoidia bacterium]|nr:CaiB/BaiF CoA-transferase family protein [Dehalococcoidia bacterium]